MEELLVAILSMLLVLVSIPLYLWKRRHDSRSPDSHEDESQVALRESVVHASGSLRARTRRRPPSSASNSPTVADSTIDDDIDGSDEDAGTGDYSEAKATRKKGHLSGVMDDGGKYMYISLEEMKAAARGRFSISI